MASFDGKLRDAFNACAGKVVDNRELESLFLAALEQKLSKDEMHLLLSLPAQEDRLDGILSDPARRDALAQEIGDGSLGIYGGKNSIYLNSRLLEIAADFSNVPLAMVERTVEAFITALNTARDHRAEVKSGALFPLKPR